MLRARIRSSSLQGLLISIPGEALRTVRIFTVEIAL